MLDYHNRFESILSFDKVNIIQCDVIIDCNYSNPMIYNSNKKQSEDKTDISWITKQTACWVYDPYENEGAIYKKGIIKGVIPLAYNKGNSKVMGLLQNGVNFDTKAINLERRSLENRLQRDLIQLDIINGAEVLHQLKRKLEEKQIHTYLWNSLIIINPFQYIHQQYSEKTLRSYIESIYAKQEDERKFPPHVFGYISGLLKNMKESDKVQVLSISGESGSGKTQTNKQCLRTISYCCQLGKDATSARKSIQNKILKCDPILQAFGNAKTVKNDNSSRFGKLITLHINTIQFAIKKSEIRNFFLQKSRVISQAKGQRNFHIFYQMIKYADPKIRLKHKLCKQNGSLMALSDFAYISNKSHIEISNDQQMWHELLHALQSLNFSQQTIQQIWQIVSAVLLIGNLEYDQSCYSDNQPCDFVSHFLVQSIAELLQVETKQLQNGLVFYRKTIVGQIMDLPLTKKQCIQTRDSTAKAIYEGLFNWLINQLNTIVNYSESALKYQNDKSLQLVKLLDIYGFQVFQYNNFEQLCVNYTNQRIHQIYLDQVFKHEKATLQKEGLQAVLSQLNFTDNVKIIELLDTLPKSIYNLLDQSCSVNVKDQDFLANAKKLHQSHPNFPSSNSVNVRKSFIISHTPGHIQYMVQGFRDKNKDFIKQDIMNKFILSNNTVLRAIFKDKIDQLKQQSNKKFLGSKIRKQVNHLANQMSLNSELHFIRCIKPNQNKLPFTFVQRTCYNQIKYLGILDTVQLKKDSYHVRMTYSKFYQKYGIIKGNVSSCIAVSQGTKEQKQCKQITIDYLKQNFDNQKLQYLFGNHKFFMKMSTQSYFDALLKNKTKNIHTASTVIKAFYRWKKRKTQKKIIKTNIVKIQRAVRQYLKIATLVRKKLAVKVIEREWIRYYQQFFNRKKKKPIMILQKYIKRQIGQKKYKDKKKAAFEAKSLIVSCLRTKKFSQNYQKRCFIKKQFLSYIYEKIWQKMKLNYMSTIEKHLMGWHIRLNNKHLVFRAQKNARNRQIKTYNDSLSKYLKSCAVSSWYWNRQRAVIKIQSFYRMARLRKKYLELRRKSIFIQKQWRKYKKDKAQNIQFNRKYFNSQHQQHFSLNNQQMNQKQIWRQYLFRSFEYSSSYKSKGQEYVMSLHQKMKKQKIILFYYLIDFQIFCDLSQMYPNNIWIKNYSQIFRNSWEKMNPIQYVDISDSHTICSTTNKIYSWGSNFDGQRGTKQNINKTDINQINLPNGGKICEIQVKQSLTIINTMEPDDKIVFGNEKKFEEGVNKEWKTLRNTFVNFNGTVLTLQGVSLIKINIPEKVIQLSCGMGHVICKTSLKKAYAWGHNQEGQLGLGHTHRVKNPKIIEFQSKNRIIISNIAASAKGTVLVDSNCRIWWCGTNGTISKKSQFQQCLLGQKSQFIDNGQKYSIVRVIPKWSKTMSIIGVTIACHQSIFKTQISMRKKTIENLMSKWSETYQTINPPYMQNIAGNFLERHMPLPKTPIETSRKPKGMTQREIKDKIVSQINYMDQIQRQLLSSRQNRIQKKHSFE